MNHPLRTLGVLALVLASCGDKGEEEKTAALPVWDDIEHIGVANWDDDDANGQSDWDDELGDDEELGELSWSAGEIEGGTLTLTLDASEDIRVWVDGEIVLDEETTEVSFEDFEEVSVGVEFNDTLAEGVLTAELTADEGEVTQVVSLLSAPLILNHHLQPVEMVMAMEYSGAGGNTDFIEVFEDVLGDRFEGFPVNRYQWDVWIQDEIEFGTMVSPAHTVDFVIDSIRMNNGGGLDDVPEDYFEGVDFGRRTWGAGGASSQDSFGNLEVSPPVNVDGVEYPFGRIFHGNWRNGGITPKLTAMLDNQKVQKPFEIDVSFLCVGHVDEFQTFVPDSTAPKGFRWIVNDVQLARDYLEAQDPDMTLSRYQSGHGYGTIGDILDDDELWAMNEDIQVDYIDPVVDDFKAELGLTEDDIIRIPGIVEEVRGCGGTTVALIPGTANMTVVPLESGETHLFMPDPFLRVNPNIASDDFKTHIEGLLPAELEPHWLDDWEWYHLALGEVHCGSNVIRTPIANWWEEARHLIGGE